MNVIYSEQRKGKRLLKLRRLNKIRSILFTVPMGVWLRACDISKYSGGYYSSRQITGLLKGLSSCVKKKKKSNRMYFMKIKEVEEKDVFGKGVKKFY